MPGHDVYLVGSVPMAECRAGVRDGQRGAWAGGSSAFPTARPASAATGSPGSSRCSPAIRRSQKSGEFFRVHASGTGRERYTLKPGCAPEDVRFDNLFYADIAKQSYAVFKRLKDAGKIAPDDQVPGRSGAGALGDLALSGRRAARADRPDLQRGAQARDRQDRGGDPA